MGCDGYEELFIAIFKQAFEDDLKREPQELLESVGKTIDKMCDKQPLLEAAVFLRDSKLEELNAAIRQKVCFEARAWPEDCDMSEYRRRYGKIRAYIINTLIDEQIKKLSSMKI